MKFIRVNMSEKTVVAEAVPDAYRGIGGRALTSSYINDHVPATCDPTGADNVLVFAPGYFSGTPLINTSRLSVGAKSPLTGGIKESNVGGTVAAALPAWASPPSLSRGWPQPASAWSSRSMRRATPACWMLRIARG